MSHLSLVLASRSLTQPFLLLQNRILSPLGEKRGNQSTSSPLVICFTSEPSVFIVNRSWLPTRELDQTMVPLAFSPTSRINAAASVGGASSAPLGGSPVIEEQPVSIAQPNMASRCREIFELMAVVLWRSTVRWVTRRAPLRRLGESSDENRHARHGGRSRGHAWPRRGRDWRR